jgi:hypothetical protein
VVSNAEAVTPIRSDLQALIEAVDGTDALADGDWVEFFVDGLYVVANVVDVVGRLRIRVYLHIDDERLVEDWVAQQPAPRSGLLQASYIEEGAWRPRLVFERPVGDHDWSTDPILEDVAQYLAAWLDDTAVEYACGNRPPYSVRDDPRDVSPGSAWLLKGSEASFPTSAELHRDRAAANVGIFTWAWTTASQTQIGDLVLIYFMSPRKAVHFVARAASNAFFSRDVAVNADGKVNQAQWWGYFTTPIEIEPIPVDVLRSAVGGYLPLRGRSGLYLRPDAITGLKIRAADPADQAELERVVSVPVGLAELPDPADIIDDVWRDLAAGALPLEAHVSTHIVEPLLRDLLAGTGLTWRREYRVGRRWADFVIVDGDAPVHVIEVKKVIKEGPQSGWNDSPDFTQLRWYADQLGTSGTLIDSHRVLLVERAGTRPVHEIVRRASTKADLEAIRQHLVGAWRPRPGRVLRANLAS